MISNLTKGLLIGGPLLAIAGGLGINTLNPRFQEIKAVEKKPFAQQYEGIKTDLKNIRNYQKILPPKLTTWAPAEIANIYQGIEQLRTSLTTAETTLEEKMKQLEQEDILIQAHITLQERKKDYEDLASISLGGIFFGIGLTGLGIYELIQERKPAHQTYQPTA